MGDTPRMHAGAVAAPCVPWCPGGAAGIATTPTPPCTPCASSGLVAPGMLERGDVSPGRLVQGGMAPCRLVRGDVSPRCGGCTNPRAMAWGEGRGGGGEPVAVVTVAAPWGEATVAADDTPHRDCARVDGAPAGDGARGSSG